MTIAIPLSSWPPPYTVRLSARAKRVTLSISAKQGLEIVIPKHRIRKPNIERLLAERRSWIEKHLPHFLRQKAEQIASPPVKPFLLNLRAIQKVFYFSYLKTEHKHIKIKLSSATTNVHVTSPAFANIPVTTTESADIEPAHAAHIELPNNYLANIEQANTFIVSGPIENDTLVFAALRRFLKETAAKFLIPWLYRLSEQMGLHYSETSIRSQSTLWGSCTAAKKISLNVKLLFLPEHLTRYILIHELCHIKHLNHSNRFWTLVKSFDPNCLLHRREMKKAAQFVPAWMEDN